MSLRIKLRTTQPSIDAGTPVGNMHQQAHRIWVLLLQLTPLRYFDSEKFSDITIRVNGNDIKAHKVVLANGSEYFKACFDGGFKEAASNVMTLYGDDADDIRHLVKHIYGWNYKEYTDTAYENFAKHADGIEWFVGLYMVGQKYLVPDASTDAKSTFAEIIGRMSRSDAYVENFGEIVLHVYVKHADEATDLRELLVLHFVEHVWGSAAYEKFRDLCKAVPEFTFDVMNAAVQQQTVAVARKAGPVKKRKI